MAYSFPMKPHIWWAWPGKLAGMAMPFVHHERRRPGAKREINAFQDDIPHMWQAGIRAVVCLLPGGSDQQVFTSLGFKYLHLPLRDGAAPTFPDISRFVPFVRENLDANRPVVAHCAAGMGRTGTVLAAYLIAEGWSTNQAIREIRSARPGAIETSDQTTFLAQFAAAIARGR